MKDLFEELCKGCNAKALYDEEYCDACNLKDDIAEHDAEIINKFAEELKSRLGDAIYPKDFESMKNLIDDLARQTKEAEK